MSGIVKNNDLGFTHNFIPGQDDDGRILLLLHGTGGNEDDLLTISQMIDERATILAPRGKVLENGMPRYFMRLAEGIFDLEDLKFRTNELADFVINASKKYSFDMRSVVAIGYSNGANIAASLLLIRPESMKRAILFRTMIPLIPEKLPDLSEKKVFISGGKFDSQIPQKKTIELKGMLEEAGAEVKMNWEESDHALVRNDIVKARSWLSTS
ncbi:MAG: alpha/beta hydrolase [Nitrososphaerales archaeon]